MTSGCDARAQIDALVRAFYRDVATDDLLGPIFDGMGVDWPSHVDKLSDFWAWQLLGEPGYQGNPLRAHEPVHACYGLRPEHYERWLTMFTEVVDEHLSGPLAEAAKVRSAKMARALRRRSTATTAPASRRPRCPPRSHAPRASQRRGCWRRPPHRRLTPLALDDGGLALAMILRILLGMVESGREEGVSR